MKPIEQAVKILKQGGVVVYPTDTAYGLAVDATNASAVKKLYRLKGRGFNKPIHVIVPKHLHTIPYASNKQANILMKKFWPGALTIVLPLAAHGKSWQILSAGTKTLGIRRPKNKLALDLSFALGRPITTTSANLSGNKNNYSIAEVKKQFQTAKFKPDFYLDGGRLKLTKPSTVVMLAGKDVKILRPGPITEKQIQNVLFQPSNQHRS